MSVASVADLLLRICDRDPSAWDEILRRYSELVTMIVRSFRMQEADRHDAIQMTWLRLAEYADRVQFPERLGGWLATTARRECIHILRQAKHGPSLTDRTSEFSADPAEGPEQRAIDAEITRILRTFVEELPPRQQALIKTQFTGDLPSYAEIAQITDIHLGAIGPTRARALRQLRDKLHEYERGSETRSGGSRPTQARVLRQPRHKLHEYGLGSGTDVAEAVGGELIEGDRTGSYILDDLLDKAEQVLREKLEPKIVHLGNDGSQGAGDEQLDELLHRADAELRKRVLSLARSKNPRITSW